jgi:hypothetical protein
MLEKILMMAIPVAAAAISAALQGLALFLVFYHVSDYKCHNQYEYGKYD